VARQIKHIPLLPMAVMQLSSRSIAEATHQYVDQLQE
jgi:hypothetical protein